MDVSDARDDLISELEPAGGARDAKIAAQAVPCGRERFNVHAARTLHGADYARVHRFFMR